MLVLSRKLGEEVIIGSAIRVVVLKVAGGKVKLGFAAPSDVTICRKEISQTPCETVTAPAANLSRHDGWRKTRKK